jgi:hypothetical protein
VPVHFYWCGPLGRKPAFSLKSFLATQNLERLEPWLWLDGPPDDGGQLRDLASHVRVQRYDPDALARGTPLEGEHRLTAPESPAARSDAARLMVLQRHGGLYVDMDTLFLRDLLILLDAPLGRSPFCYRWSGQTEFATNAVFRQDAGARLGQELMTRARALGSCHPRQLLRHADLHDVELLELPCPLFDPLWLHFDGWDRYRGAPFGRFRDFFRPFGPLHRPKPKQPWLRNFFPGAFAYQWHGLWQAPEVPSSWFGLLEAEVDERLRAKLKQGRS